MPEYKDDRAQMAYRNWERAVNAIEREAADAAKENRPLGSRAVQYRKNLARKDYDKQMAKIQEDQKVRPVLL